MTVFMEMKERDWSSMSRQDDFNEFVDAFQDVLWEWDDALEYLTNVSAEVFCIDDKQVMFRDSRGVDLSGTFTIKLSRKARGTNQLRFTLRLQKPLEISKESQKYIAGHNSMGGLLLQQTMRKIGLFFEPAGQGTLRASTPHGCITTTYKMEHSDADHIRTFIFNIDYKARNIHQSCAACNKIIRL